MDAIEVMCLIGYFLFEKTRKSLTARFRLRFSSYDVTSADSLKPPRTQRKIFLRRVNAGEKTCIISEEIRLKNASVFYPVRDCKFELCGMLCTNQASGVIGAELPRKAELFTWRTLRLERVRERAVQCALCSVLGCGRSQLCPLRK